jgi:hypothetical protein
MPKLKWNAPNRLIYQGTVVLQAQVMLDVQSAKSGSSCQANQDSLQTLKTLSIRNPAASLFPERETNLNFPYVPQKDQLDYRAMEQKIIKKGLKNCGVCVNYDLRKRS